MHPVGLFAIINKISSAKIHLSSSFWGPITNISNYIMSLNSASKSEAKMGPKSEDLDVIANIMETILNNMKSHVQNIQTKNKNSNNSSINSDFPHLMNTKQQGTISNLQKPCVINVKDNEIRTNSMKNEASVSERINQNQNQKQDKDNPKLVNLKIKSDKTSFQQTQKKSKKQSTNDRPVSPRKIPVELNANNHFISRSLTTMLKELNSPKVITPGSPKLIRPKTTSRSRSPSCKGDKRNSVIQSFKNSDPLKPNLKIIFNRPPQIPVPKSVDTSKSVCSSKTGTVKKSSEKSRNEKVKEQVNVSEPIEKKMNKQRITMRSMSACQEKTRKSRTPVNSTKRQNIKNTGKPIRQTQKSVCKKSNNNNKIKINTKIEVKTGAIINNVNFQNEKKAVDANVTENQTSNKVVQVKKPRDEIFSNVPLSSVTIGELKSNENTEHNEQKEVQDKFGEIVVKLNEKIENNKHTFDTKEQKISSINEMGDNTTSLTNKTETNKYSDEKNININVLQISNTTALKESTPIDSPATSKSLTPIDPKLSTVVDPTSSTPTDPKSSTPIDPKQSTPIDPKLSTPVDPKLSTPTSVKPSQHVAQNDSDNKKVIPSMCYVKPVPTKQVVKPGSRLYTQVSQDTKTDSSKKLNSSFSAMKSSHQEDKKIPPMAQNRPPPNVFQKPFILHKSPQIIGNQISKISVRSQRTISRVPIVKPLTQIQTPAEIVQEFVNIVNKAKKERKTFTICGNYYSIRKAFLDRGWIEKMRLNVMDERDTWKKLDSMSNFELIEGIKDKEHGEKYKRMFLSKLLAGHQVDFYWDYLTNPFNVNNDNVKKTIINRFPFGGTRSYTSKIGLCESLKDFHWYCIDGYANVYFPRTYNLSIEEDVPTFINDFRTTAAISLLLWIAKNAEKPSSVISPIGQIPTSVFNFACLQCYNVIKIHEHKDIDEIIPLTKEYEWDVFLDKFYKIVHQNQHFKETENITAPLVIDQSNYVLNKIRKYVPGLDVDGYMNLWLLKPNNGSRGCGIHVCRTLRYILDTIHNRKDTKYVIQKYLERPLLIHNTKFDIRQWFLVTCNPNLHLWLYKDCYLRFSSQIFDLSKLHESIHLTNNSIQCRYRNNAGRCNALPEQNMWHSDTFRRYLSDIGHPFAWRNLIYKGIKECLIGLFMICQDKLITRVNSFELCGADFMVSEDFHPYLIEINSRPALYASTKITAKMCPKVLEDVIKVTVDYARNPKASTGSFELIYTDSLTIIPPKTANNLFIQGKGYSKMTPEIKHEDPIEKVFIKDITQNSDSTIQKILQIDPTKVRKDVKNTLEKILSIIHSEQYKNNDGDEEKNKQFKMMLTEFVDIITTVKNKTDTTG